MTSSTHAHQLTLDSCRYGAGYHLRCLDDCPLNDADPGSADVLIQTDWDFPGVASTFGWSPCHRSTDGTIDCPDCGRTTADLIASAETYLDEHIGDTVPNPGYLSDHA